MVTLAEASLFSCSAAPVACPIRGSVKIWERERSVMFRVQQNNMSTELYVPHGRRYKRGSWDTRIKSEDDIFTIKDENKFECVAHHFLFAACPLWHCLFIIQLFLCLSWLLSDTNYLSQVGYVIDIHTQIPCFRFTSYGMMRPPLNLPLNMAADSLR